MNGYLLVCAVMAALTSALHANEAESGGYFKLETRADDNAQWRDRYWVHLTKNQGNWQLVPVTYSTPDLVNFGPKGLFNVEVGDGRIRFHIDGLAHLILPYKAKVNLKQKGANLYVGSLTSYEAHPYLANEPTKGQIRLIRIPEAELLAELRLLEIRLQAARATEREAINRLLGRTDVVGHTELSVRRQKLEEIPGKLEETAKAMIQLQAQQK